MLLRGRFWGFSLRRGDTLHRLRWHLAWRSRPSVDSSRPNLVPLCTGVIILATFHHNVSLRRFWQNFHHLLAASWMSGITIWADSRTVFRSYGGLSVVVCTLLKFLAPSSGETVRRRRTCFSGARRSQMSVPPSVRMYVCPSTKSFFDFSEIWNVGRGRWVMHDGMKYECMTRSKVKVKVTSPWKSEMLPLSKAICSIIYNGSWQLTIDS